MQAATAKNMEIHINALTAFNHPVKKIINNITCNSNFGASVEYFNDKREMYGENVYACVHV